MDTNINITNDEIDYFHTWVAWPIIRELETSSERNPHANRIRNLLYDRPQNVFQIYFALVCLDYWWSSEDPDIRRNVRQYRRIISVYPDIRELEHPGLMDALLRILNTPENFLFGSIVRDLGRITSIEQMTEYLNSLSPLELDDPPNPGLPPWYLEEMMTSSEHSPATGDRATALTEQQQLEALGVDTSGGRDLGETTSERAERLDRELRQARDMIRQMEEARSASSSGQQQEEEDLRTRVTCVVCMVNRRSVVLKPCNHFAVCSTCADRLEKCPICTRDITGKEAIYWAWANRYLFSMC